MQTNFLIFAILFKKMRVYPHNQIVNFNNMDIIKNIIEIRKKAGYSQEYMAEKLNVEDSSYSRIENKKTKLDISRLAEIANVFNMRIIDLITYPEIYENVKESKIARTKVLVELDIREDEFIKFGLKEKLVQILNK